MESSLLRSLPSFRKCSFIDGWDVVFGFGLEYDDCEYDDCCFDKVSASFSDAGDFPANYTRLFLTHLPTMSSRNS